MRIEPFLDALAREAIQSALGADAPAIVRATQDPKHGDYQVDGVLPLAKEMKRPPRELASSVAERLSGHDAIASADVAGPGFINLRLREPWLAARLGEALSDRERDGVEPVARPQTIVVDYSGPNIAKQMHVGHLRSTIIGDAIVRLLRFVGHEVIGDNHLGDWGTQFGLLIVGMREWGGKEALEQDALVELERVYKLANAKAKEDDSFAAQARAELAKLQSGDAENRRKWEHFAEVTKKTLDVIYERLDVRFDEWLGESAYNDMLPGVVEQLLSDKLAREDQGAICVFFREIEAASAKLKAQETPLIVRKKDGAFLYATSDIATVLYRRDRWNADRAIYVHDKRQAQHFEQVFEVAHLLGVKMKLEHVGFGTVLGADGTPLKTRDTQGAAFKLSMLLDEAEERAARKMQDPPLNLPPAAARELAPAVGIGAVKYADLSQNRLTDYKFDWEKLINFTGKAGPYLQYAHARCCNIFRKGEVDPSAAGAILLEEAAESALARRLAKLPDVVHAAAETSYPHYLAQHVYAVADEFSTFYEACPVLKAPTPELRASRLALVDLTRRQLARGLGLLGIAAPDRM